VVIGNLLNRVTGVKLHGTNQAVKFEQDDSRVRLTGLPQNAPELVTTFALECDGEPRQNHEGKRAEKPRAGVYKVV
jgi:alpha-L-fucosidase